MRDHTQPLLSRGAKLSGAAIVAALIALLAIAPLASAASDPVASGTTTITLNQALYKQLKKNHVKVTAVKPATVKGKKVTLPIDGAESSMDPTTGAGVLVHKGGLKLKAGGKKAVVKRLVLNTGRKTLTGKIGKKKLKIATLAGVSFVRDGFGADVSAKKLKLTKQAAKQLNKALDENVFKANKSLGSSFSAEQPLTVTLVPTGNVEFNADNALLKKLNDVEAKVSTTAPAVEKATGKFEFPISSGSIAPTATAGVVNTSGGVTLLQKLPKSETEFLETEIALNSFYIDLTAHTVGVEVVAKSNASTSLNLGALPRSSIADLTLTGAKVTTDVTNRRVTVEGASATLQPLSAEVLEGFVQVYQAWYAGVLQAKGLTEQEAKEKAAEKVKGDHIAAPNPLGTFSFTAQTQ